MSGTTESTETRLVTWGRSQMELLAQQVEVRLAIEAAKTVKGMVVTSDDQAALLADTLKRVKLGRATLKDLESHPQRGPLWYLERARDAVKGVTSPIYTLLDAALAEGKAAADQWRAEQRLQAEEVAERERARLAREHEAAVAQAAAARVEAPPEPEMPATVEAPAAAKGSIGSLGVQKRLVARLVDPAKVPLTWLELRQKPACDAFREAMERDSLQTVHQMRDRGVVVVFRGVEFQYVESSVIR